MTADGVNAKRLAGEVAALVVLAGVGVYLASIVSDGATGLLALALVGIVAAVVIANVVRGLVGSSGGRGEVVEDEQ